jgi:hypothetical protein
LSAPASQADESEQNTTEEQQKTDDQLVADLEDTVESALPARDKGLNLEASQSDEPQQISSEKQQDSGSEVVAALQSSSEDQQANRDRVSNPLPSAPNGCERIRIEALQNHDSVADLQSGLEVRQVSGDKSSSPPPSTPHGQGDDRMEVLQQARNEVIEGLQLTSENPQRGTDAIDVADRWLTDVQIEFPQGICCSPSRPFDNWQKSPQDPRQAQPKIPTLLF